MVCINRGNDSINRNAVGSSSAYQNISSSSTTTNLFKLNGSSDSVIDDGVDPLALFVLGSGISRDPSTSDNKFDAPNALARAVRLSNDLSVDEIRNLVDNSELIRVIF